MYRKGFRNKRFTFICDAEERQLIGVIATHLNRSQGDAIRHLIRIASQELLNQKELQIDNDQMTNNADTGEN